MMSEIVILRLMVMMIWWAIFSFILVYDFEGKNTFNKKNWIILNVAWFISSYVSILIWSIF